MGASRILDSIFSPMPDKFLKWTKPSFNLDSSIKGLSFIGRCDWKITDWIANSADHDQTAQSRRQTWAGLNVDTLMKSFRSYFLYFSGIYSSDDEPQRVFYLRMKFNLPKPGSKTKHSGFMVSFNRSIKQKSSFIFCLLKVLVCCMFKYLGFVDLLSSYLNSECTFIQIVIAVLFWHEHPSSFATCYYNLRLLLYNFQGQNLKRHQSAQYLKCISLFISSETLNV